MRFLIDGYNLLHALGLGPRAIGLSLERSRSRLIEWLARELGERSNDVCVVFDSRCTRAQSEQTDRGVPILYSSGQTADDVIEDLIRKERTPAQLTIVSNDNRLQQAAERGGCAAFTCADFVDWLQTPDRQTKAPRAPTDEKPSGLSRDEMDEWLKHFGEAR